MMLQPQAMTPVYPLEPMTHVRAPADGSDEYAASASRYASHGSANRDDANCTLRHWTHLAAPSHQILLIFIADYQESPKHKFSIVLSYLL